MRVILIINNIIQYNMKDCRDKIDGIVENIPMHHGEICFCSCTSTWFQRYFGIMNIIIFETTGMALISYIILTFDGTILFPGSVITIFGLFVCFLWTGRFTGTFLNPALVIACMLKKQRSIPFIKGLVYIFTEIVGSFIGTFIAWSVNQDLPAPFDAYSTTNQQVGSFAREIIGSFIYCTLVLILVSSDTTFVEMDIQIWISIPMILVGVCVLLNLPLGVNPAWSLTYQIVWGINNDNNFAPMSYCWTFIVGPLVGGLFSGIFFQLIFRKFILAYKVELKHEQQLMIQRLNQEQRRKLKRRNTQIELV